MNPESRAIIEEILDDIALLYGNAKTEHARDRMDRSAMHFIIDLEDLATHQERDQLYHYYSMRAEEMRQ